MNKSKANELLAKLSGRELAGLTLEKAIGTGVSAAVYQAVDTAGGKFALKLYDAAFASIERLNRELLLKGHACDNVVKIYI